MKQKIFQSDITLLIVNVETYFSEIHPCLCTSFILKYIIGAAIKSLTLIIKNTGNAPITIFKILYK